jgi:hypothetical protein
MPNLERELSKAMSVDVTPVIEKIKQEKGGLEGLAAIIEEVVVPLIGTNKAAILRLAHEIDKILAHSPDVEEDAGD